VKKFALLALLGLGFSGDSNPAFVVHEWGTFTSVSGSDGVMVDWRPLVGVDDLPKFVYREGTGKGFLNGRGAKDISPVRVRMETPVIYFYSDRERIVSAKVGFPKGRITEWYPAAASIRPEIDWGKFKIAPATAGPLPRESAESHYYPARETDASLVRVWNRSAALEEYQYEKFLFYRGVGTFDLPLKATLDGRKVKVVSVGPYRPSSAILFENAAGKVGFRKFDAPLTQQTLDRPELSGNADGVMAELEKSLTATGLYEKEARAMVKTWRDSWFEEGLRVFYLVPRESTDQILPLTIEPKPDQTVRVLVGRAEIITPEQENRMTDLVRRMGSASETVRTSAQADLKKLGRFAEPTLRRILPGTKDPALKTRIQELILK